MYLTSQRVSAPGDAPTGINTFLYKHEGTDTGIDWNVPDLVRIVDELPGTPVSNDIEVPPGGNVVRSYLDIVAPDTIEVEAIRVALQQFEKQWSPSQMAQAIRVGGVALRLGMELRLESRALEELRSLVERSLRLLGRAHQLRTEASAPLRILVTRDAQARSYALDEASLVRLQLIHGPMWKPPRVSVSHDVQAPLPGEPVEFYSHLAPLVTGLPLDALVPLGGLRFTDSEGTVLWEWPLLSNTRGYCLGCHQQGTLRFSHGGYRCTFCGNLQGTNGLWVATLT